MVSESVAKCTRPLNAADAVAAAAQAAGHYFHFYLPVFILDPLARPLARSRREKRMIPPALNLTLIEVTSLSVYLNL